ncbi:terpene synthase family protein [Kitasatospora purpeofusca]|uniref:Terpene synthase n=1 Tax=Kitasatospora purpeofusca TaxID=67352 RepID=A0ABZ1TRA2_9ACTN|nr:terpene synthase family protein [Kitasatospora purpeofusca]
MSELVVLVAGSMRIPARRNAGAHGVEQAVTAWARTHLPAHRRSAGSDGVDTYGSAAAWTFPDARPDLLPLLAEWGVWFFWTDDLLSSGHDLFAHTSDGGLAFGSHHGRSLPGPEHQCIVDLFEHLRSRTEPVAPPGWVRRFRRSLKDCLAAFDTERGHRATGRPPALEEFVALRRRASGMFLHLRFVEFGLDIELPDWVFETADLDEVLHCAADIAGWTNDVFSHQREKRAGEVDNIFAVLRGENPDMDETTALALVVNAIGARSADLRAAAVAFRNRYEDRLAREGGLSQVRSFLDGIADTVAGNLAWTAESPRYRPHHGGG